MLICCGPLLQLQQFDTINRFLLLVFSVSPFKIDQNQNPSIEKVQNLGMKGGKYAKILAKIQVRGIY